METGDREGGKEMVVAGEAGGWFDARIGESARDLVENVLSAFLEVASQALGEAEGEELGRSRRRIAELEDLRRQLGETIGMVHLGGARAVIIEVIKSTAGQATHDLDVQIEFVRALKTPLTEETITETRDRLDATCAAVEALIEAESGLTA